MLKKYRKTLIVTTIIILLPMLAGMILWNKLPEQFPIHFNAAGEVDSYSSKAFGVFGLPLILVLFQWLCTVGSLKMDPKAENLEGKVFSLVQEKPAVMPILQRFTKIWNPPQSR